MNPHIIKLLLKGHEEKVKEQDALNWCLGQYMASALDATVCNAFLWRKKGEKAHKYIDRPIMQKFENKQEQKNKVPLTEDEKKKQTEQLFTKLRIMGANFNLNHKDGMGS